MGSQNPPDKYYSAEVVPSGYVTYYDPDAKRYVTEPLFDVTAPATSPSPHFGVLTAAQAAPLIQKEFG